jgi:hypothetical protein
LPSQHILLTNQQAMKENIKQYLEHTLKSKENLIQVIKNSTQQYQPQKPNKLETSRNI